MAAEVMRPRMILSGAGTAIRFALDHARAPTSVASSASTSGESIAESTETQSAYLVTPTAHIGRVVTGIVIVAQETRLLGREFASNTSSDVDEFGLAAISFADKLAEQGYKVLALSLFRSKSGGDGSNSNALLTDSSAVEQYMHTIEQAVLFLKQKQDIQRVALCGVGAGADLALKMSIERPALLDCSIMMCPNGELTWTLPESVDSSDDSNKSASVPMLLLVGGKNPFSRSEQFQQLRDAFASGNDPLLRARVFANQDKGFAFSYITDEDAATQAIAEILDWLVAHLHRFRQALGTSDNDHWWPQGRNGPFFNVGLKTWQDTRTQWIAETQPRPPAPPPVPSHLLFDGLSSVRRTFELPQRMRLADVIELFVEIWDVQQ